MPTDPRFVEVVSPLAEFCERHGYRYRWSVTRGDAQWSAKVQIIDPAETTQRGKIRAWMGSTGHSEVGVLKSAVAYAIEESQRKLDQEETYRRHVPGTI